MNPMLLNMFSSRMGPIKQMMQTVRAAQNPALALQQMAQGNPQLQQALQLVQQSGGNPQAAFEKLARDNGIDPQTILGMLNGI
jgi:hypothetical protein